MLMGKHFLYHKCIFYPLSASLQGSQGSIFPFINLYFLQDFSRWEFAKMGLYTFNVGLGLHFIALWEKSYILLQERNHIFYWEREIIYFTTREKSYILLQERYHIVYNKREIKYFTTREKSYILLQERNHIFYYKREII